MRSRKPAAEMPDDAPGAPVSKSQRKRDALESRSLAQQLLAAGEAQLRRLPLEAETLEAIKEARRIRSRVARKRQLQYVARLLRMQDTAAVEAAMEESRSAARQLVARQHRCEAWRDRLVAGGDAALQDLVRSCPGIDVQALRQLLRRAQAELAATRPPAAARALFRLLHETDARDGLPSPD